MNPDDQPFAFEINLPGFGPATVVVHHERHVQLNLGGLSYCLWKPDAESEWKPRMISADARASVDQARAIAAGFCRWAARHPNVFRLSLLLRNPHFLRRLSGPFSATPKPQKSRKILTSKPRRGNPRLRHT